MVDRSLCSTAMRASTSISFALTELKLAPLLVRFVFVVGAVFVVVGVVVVFLLIWLGLFVVVDEDELFVVPNIWTSPNLLHPKYIP